MVGPHGEIEYELRRDQQHDHRQERAQFLAAQFRAPARAELRADHTTQEEHGGKHDIDRVVGHRLKHGDRGGHEDDLKQRGAGHHRGRHAEDIDHRRHHDEAAADAHHRREHADKKAEGQRQQRADVKLGAPEAHLERQAVQPIMLMQLTRRAGATTDHPGMHAFDQHQRAERQEQRGIGEADEKLDLARAAQQGEEPDAEHRTGEAADEHQPGHDEIEIAAPPVRERARYRGADQLIGGTRHRDRRRHADQDQQRREQETAADAEHARENADRRAEQQQADNVERDRGDGQVDVEYAQTMSPAAAIKA